MAIFVLFFSLLFYLLTLTPTVNLHDSGEMITAAYSLGISHPPGYPLYCIFGKLLMSIIPISNIALRMNFFSCLSAALCSFFLYFIGRVLYQDKIIAAAISLCFSFSRIFWQQASFAEKYTLNALFLAILILILFIFKETKKAKWLYLFAFILGLSFSHHFQTIFIIPSSIFFIVSTLWKRPKGKGAYNYSYILLFFIIPLLLYIYLPIRAACNPEANWGSPNTLERFISHITVKEYRHYFIPFNQWGKNLIAHLSFFPPQFTWFIFILTIIGAFIMLKKRKSFALFFGLIIGFDILHSIRYSIHNIEDYYIPTFLVLSICLGEVLMFLKRFLKYSIFFFFIFLIPLFANHYPSNRDRDFYSYDYGRNILDPLEANSILLIMGDTFAFPLWYLHFVEKVREDVILIDKLELRYAWYCENLKKRYPELSFEPGASKSDPALISERFIDIVKRNIEKRAIYIPLPFADEVVESHLLIPNGIVHKILPKNLPTSRIMDEITRSTFTFKYRKTGIFMEERTKHNYENYAIAYETRGRFLAERLLYDDAIFCFNEAIKIDPNKPGIFYNLGTLYQKKARLNEAISAYKKALLLDKKIFIYHSLGACYLELGMFDKAISQFKEALNISPNDPNSYYNLAVAYWKGGRIKDAISSYKKVLELSPNYPGAAESLRILQQGL